MNPETILEKPERPVLLPQFDLELVPEIDSNSAIRRAFGKSQQILEGAIYDFASHFCPEYQGGLWDFYTNSRGAFAMGLDPEKMYQVENNFNGWHGELNGQQFGVGISLIVYSSLGYEHDVCRDLHIELYEAIGDNNHDLWQFLD